MIGIVWGSKNYQTIENWLTDNNLPYRLIKTASDVDGIDVAIFCGGPDLGVNVERDKFENAIFQLCKEKDIAMLGICRGMQVISNWLGAPLVNDLGVLNPAHNAVFDGDKKNSAWHAIQLSDGRVWQVNSRHHQAVEQSPFGCQLVGQSADGVLELLYDKNERFLLVQSHPEMVEMRQTEIAAYCIQWMQRRMDIALLKQLYAINSKSGHEQEIKDFVTNRLRSLSINIHQDAFGNVYITKGKADNYPCVAAHLDEVHMPTHRYIKETGGRLWAVGDEQYPIGIGADDKNGIWVIIKLLETTTIPLKILLTVQEEKDNGIAGCRGASHCDLSWFDNVKYIIECDRKGNGDLVTVGKRQGEEIRLCKDDWIPVKLQQKYGYAPVVGGSTDVVAMKANGLRIPVCNLSCGYYNAHNDGEYTVFNELTNCLEFVKEFINQNENNIQN